MPARYDTIIVVRKRNARGDEVEYHTVGRRGPSIWRTGEPNPPGTPGYQAAYDAAIGLQAALEPPATGHGWRTVDDLLDAYERSREFCRLAPRTRTDYLKGLVDVRARYGSAPLGIINSVALKGNVLDWIEVRWAGKGADKRLDPFKFALSWATGRHPERVPVNYLHGIPRFYEGADRAEIIWEDAEVDLFCQPAPELHADAVRLARETGLRIGDLVELERSEIKKAPDGSRAIILRPNKRRRRIVNMPLTARRRGHHRQGADLAPPDPEADAGRRMGSRPALARGPRVRHRVRHPPGAPVQRPARDEGDRDGVVGDQRARPRHPHRVEDRDRREDARRLRRAEPGPRHGGGAPRAGEAGRRPLLTTPDERSRIQWQGMPASR